MAVARGRSVRAGRRGRPQRGSARAGGDVAGAGARRGCARSCAHQLALRSLARSLSRAAAGWPAYGWDIAHATPHDGPRSVFSG